MSSSQPQFQQLLHRLLPLAQQVKDAYDSGEKAGRDQLNYFDEEIKELEGLQRAAEIEINQLEMKPAGLDEIMNQIQLAMAQVFDMLSMLLIRESGANILPMN